MSMENELVSHVTEVDELRAIILDPNNETGIVVVDFFANVKQNFKCFLFCYLANSNTKKKLRCFFVLFNKLK